MTHNRTKVELKSVKELREALKNLFSQSHQSGIEMEQLQVFIFIKMTHNRTKVELKYIKERAKQFNA